MDSVFKESDNVVYFAHYWHPEWRRSVAAYDLATGKTLWHTPLRNQYRPTFHTSGLITLFLRDGAVCVAGHESNGDYIEVLDQETGERLAHRVFPKGHKTEPAE